MKLVPVRGSKEVWPSLNLFENFMNRFFEDDSDMSERMMAIDIVDYDDRMEISANLPGFKKKDINMSINDNQLLIEAKREEQVEDSKGSYCRCERYKGNYRRILTLTDEADRDNIRARFEDGVLIITVPKIEPKPAKEIKIS